MSTKFSTHYLIAMALICLTIIGCHRRPSCVQSDEVKLGTTDYSSEFKQWQTEADSDIITLSNDSISFVLRKQQRSDNTPNRLLEYLVCESFDIKTFKAYAYYEYENLSSTFLDDNMTMLLSVEPEISYEDKVRTESIFLSFSEGVYGVKGRVPITNGEAIKPTEPNGQLFSYHVNIEIGDRQFEDIWALIKEESGIYYSESKGIIALKIRELYIYREE